MFIYQIVSPKIVQFHPFHSQPNGSLVILTCNAYQGSHPLKFQWFKNEHLIGIGKAVIETKQQFSQLTLPKISAEDSANYSCVVSNPFGIDKQWSVLQVKGLFLFFKKFHFELTLKCGAIGLMIYV